MTDFCETISIRRGAPPGTTATARAVTVKRETAFRDDGGSSRETRIFILPGGTDIRLGDGILCEGNRIFAVAKLKLCRDIDGKNSYWRAEAVR